VRCRARRSRPAEEPRAGRYPVGQRITVVVRSGRALDYDPHSSRSRRGSLCFASSQPSPATRAVPIRDGSRRTAGAAVAACHARAAGASSFRPSAQESSSRTGALCSGWLFTEGRRGHARSVLLDCHRGYKRGTPTNRGVPITTVLSPLHVHPASNAHRKARSTRPASEADRLPLGKRDRVWHLQATRWSALWCQRDLPSDYHLRLVALGHPSDRPPVARLDPRITAWVVVVEQLLERQRRYASAGGWSATGVRGRSSAGRSASTAKPRASQ
jgi:hypothetical protein